jgi:hypothetical protein
LTSPVWPGRGFPIGRPVATSHSRIVSSALPLARVLPSGLNATESTQLVWPVRMPIPGSAAAVSIA